MQYLLFLDKQLHRIIAFRDQSEAERDAALNSKLHIMLVMHKPLLFMLLLQYIKKSWSKVTRFIIELIKNAFIYPINQQNKD